ncbi:MAG: FAD-binding oxidoreductase [Aquincola sp.]|uniref:NAD(P)/FAD-dependent oxidoreductase n=1 Tax=uncultured Aquincola sp. TaxID=886556 RepID=UPI0032B12FAD|nr:FAD-binding oxidoreductase [Aquincola sp.]|tara:strand:- start:30 stop:1337 length:1308 start_codon:yes stop_codon:yes gene_type:complete
MGFLETDRELTRLSYYDATAPRGAAHAPLLGDAKADVAIVGGGLAGLSAAIELRQRGLDVMLLEAQHIGFGASGRNGGQVIHGLAADQASIEAELGLHEARRVWDMTLQAIDLIHDRCARFGIDAQWRDGYLGVAVNPRKARALREGVDHLAQHYGYAQQWIEQAELPRWIDSPRYVAGAYDPRSGHLHPLKYTQGLARAALDLGVRLHEGSAVTSMQPEAGGQRLRTAQGSVLARQVLLAGNVYLQEFSPRLAPRLSPRVMPVGTYIVCSEALGAERAQALVPCGAAVCDNNFVLDYFRPTADHRMLYGGRASYTAQTPADLAEGMRQQMVGTFPQLAGVKVEYAWGGFVDISMSRAPDFGRIGRDVYYLQGFSGHGLALTGLAGQVVAEAMAGDAGRFDVFAQLQHRAFPGGRLLRMPALALAMAYYRLRDLL